MQERSIGKHTTLTGALVAGLVMLVGEGTAFAQRGRVVADFDGDGSADLAVGAPLANGGAGSVSVFLSIPGIGFAANTPTFTFPGKELREHYGTALTAANIDRDVQSELIVGSPLWNGGRGRITVIEFNRRKGNALVPLDYEFDQSTPGVPGSANPNDRFGAALAAGDFDGDGYDDVAIGVPGDDTSAVLQAGAVNVLYGSSGGIDSDRREIWHLSIPGMAGSAVTGDQFGFSLVTGDFNADDRDDLAIGAPSKNRGFNSDEGVVCVILGDSGGLETTGNRLLRPVASAAVNGAQFGYALAAGNFNGDDFTDLAIGMPRASFGEFAGAGETPRDLTQSGAVVVHFGHRAGVTDLTTQVLEVSERREANATFGWALAAGDFNDDGYADLAVGAPGKDVDSVKDAGAVTVFYGTFLETLTDAQFWHQNVFHVRDLIERGDAFGASLTADDFNRDGIQDLAIGVPIEDVGTSAPVVDAGAVGVLYGTTIGIGAEGNHLLFADTRQVGARFGSALSR